MRAMARSLSAPISPGFAVELEPVVPTPLSVDPASTASRYRLTYGLPVCSLTVSDSFSEYDHVAMPSIARACVIRLSLLVASLTGYCDPLSIWNVVQPERSEIWVQMPTTVRVSLIGGCLRPVGDAGIDAWW